MFTLRPQAVRQVGKPSRTVLSFESVVAHGATDSAGVASGYIEDGWREYAANGQKKGRAAGFSTWRTA